MEEWIEGEEVGVVGLSTAEAHFFSGSWSKGMDEFNGIPTGPLVVEALSWGQSLLYRQLRMSWMGKQWLSCVLASCSGENIQPVLFDKAIFRRLTDTLLFSKKKSIALQEHFLMDKTFKE